MEAGEMKKIKPEEKKQFIIVNEKLNYLSRVIEELEYFVCVLRDGEYPLEEKANTVGPESIETFGGVWNSLPDVLSELTDRIQNHHQSLRNLLM